MSENKNAKTKKEESKNSEAKGLAKELEQVEKIALKIQERSKRMTDIDENKLRERITFDYPT